MLSNQDKTQVTNYRITLYAGRKMEDDEREEAYKLFLKEAKKRFTEPHEKYYFQKYEIIQTKETERRRK